MVPSISMNRMHPMISSTDPFLSGPSSGLLSPSDSLDWDAVHPAHFPDYEQVKPTQLTFSVADFEPKKTFLGEVDQGEFSFSDEGIDAILNSLDGNSELVLTQKNFDEFVYTIQNDFPAFIPDDGLIELPDSPLSMEEDAIFPADMESFDDNYALVFEQDIPIVESPAQEQIEETVVVEEEPEIEEQPIEEKPKVVEVPQIAASRSGRVYKRKVYTDDDDDEDYEPVVKKPTKKATPKAPAKKAPSKRIRVYDEATKHQNMIAARRYRQKKRAVEETLEEIYAKEEAKNDKLKKEVEQFASEIKIMKELLSSVLEPHKIVRVTVQ